MPLPKIPNSLPHWTPTPSFALLILAAVGLSVTAISLSNVGSRTREAAAVQNAMMLGESVRAFRSLYSREVISRLDGHGLKAHHETADEPQTFPLPISLSLELADAVGETHLESTTRLYSPYPFPWNPNPGLRDDFAARAWAQLSVDPTTAVQAFEERDGRRFLRYATSDLMVESCVECHNTYPGTPRTDWKAGDLRGVLEVSLPLDRQVALAGGWASRGVYLFSLLSALFIAVALLSVFASRRASQHALRETARHRETSNQLQDAIVERELAEREHRQLAGQIQQAQKLESFNLMVGGLAHDFNNLLLPIVANTDILRERADADSTSLEMLDEVELAASRASDLCGQMLNYAGKSGATERVGMDVSALLAETGRLLAASISSNCEIQFDLMEDLPLIEGDPVQISQVALNLIKNASEAIGEGGGKILLRTGKGRTPGAAVGCDRCSSALDQDGFQLTAEYCAHGLPIAGIFFEVADNGMGMDAEMIGRIFDPFFTTKFSGRGLGLAAVQGIVRSHGGSIHIDSEQGSHTIIRVTFPESGALDSPRVHRESRSFAMGEASGTILLAEDEPAVQAVARRMLEDIGFNVVVAGDGESAVWRFSREPDRFVALFSDLTMPKMDGLQALEAMRKIRPGLPAILCSGYSERIDELTDLERGKTQFIRKPFRSRSLREKLYTLLASPSDSGAIDEAAPPHVALARETRNLRKDFKGPAAPSI